MGILSYGEQAPWFEAPALHGNPTYAFDAVGGRVVLVLLAGSMAWPASADAFASIARHRDLFDDEKACFFGVSVDPADIAEGRIAQRLPGIRWLLDHDRAVSGLFGATSDADDGTTYQPCLLLLDHRMRVAGRYPIQQADAALAAARQLVAAGCESETAPILTVPRVFEPDLCRHLIQLYDQSGGVESGFMHEQDGMTVAAVDHSFKRRSDYVIEDERLQAVLKARLLKRLVPEIVRSFQYRATRIERWLVARYDSGAESGFFKPHRDNTMRGTAHRRFACTINLNAEEFEGGDLCFPEFGPRTYRAPTGGAIIFSCSLLHEAKTVTAGRRYAFLPFFYDDEAADLRKANLKYLDLGDRPA
jgi:predicted 2-oxoglutarate/Fe(II)-dependent dioxygenase YbiX/peroxiredoxin